ncbi:hypothetical protein [Pengzhenrongella phosphoraccumulans]|uniref:hypothetical protein n=1 Tax=Pengzhenrongella phosphoraccumulans TaxID=3114394 RepID=UPI00388CF1B2
MTRRHLAEAVGFRDNAGGIPQARWMRAMTFERLVRHENFASRVATRTVGDLGLKRPDEVVTVDAHVNVDVTARLLVEAHTRATASNHVTLVYQLAVPFVGFENTRATDVKPDFAVVAPKSDSRGSWLIMGDAKDYERVRSRIEDSRMLKGFLQVAVGAASARSWSKLAEGMDVHNYGVLAVPRNSFLQPEPVVENLHDYQEEVLLQIEERRREAEATSYEPAADPIKRLVAHLEARFDPAACATCTLFSYCRAELRRSTNPADLLIELGLSRDLRRQAIGLVDGITKLGRVPASVAANIAATLDGVAKPTGQRRVDQAGVPGTVNVVLAKSDAAALGVHGIGIQRVSDDGRGPWEFHVYEDPQSPETRRDIMRRVGRAVNAAMRDRRHALAGVQAPDAVHLVVPDSTTADVLASIADNLAGIEISRLAWQRDKAMGRPALTFDGEPATIPLRISETERTAIALLLEDDRARAFSLRDPVTDVRTVLARHIVAGGPTSSAGRLDYLVGWAEADPGTPLNHREFADAIEQNEHTSGARLANQKSDELHQALVGERGRAPGGGASDPVTYQAVAAAELEYKAGILNRALDALDALPDSKLRPASRAIESDAQVVWRRRLELHASDLVRFGRTYRHWRNGLVPMIESDKTTAIHLLALSNPHAAHDLATDAGNRFVAFAAVVSLEPLIIDVDSRRITDGYRIVLLTLNDQTLVDAPTTIVDTAPKGAFKIDGLAIGPLQRTGVDETAPITHMNWTPQVRPPLRVGDALVIADFAWFSKLKGNRYLSVDKPKPDQTWAPKVDCDQNSYEEAPASHQWCCRSHESREAEWSDKLAARRARGELNPQTWPPVRDGDGFEVSPAGAATGNPYEGVQSVAPSDQTIDDLE